MVRIIIDTYDDDGLGHQAIQKQFPTMTEALDGIRSVFGDELPDFVHHVLICGCDGDHEPEVASTPTPPARPRFPTR